MWYNACMGILRAKVKNGRLVVDEPTSLPEGTVLDLAVDDEGDDLDDEERQALLAAITRAWASAKAGKLRAADSIIDELRARTPTRMAQMAGAAPVEVEFSAA